LYFLRPRGSETFCIIFAESQTLQRRSLYWISVSGVLMSQSVSLNWRYSWDGRVCESIMLVSQVCPWVRAVPRVGHVHVSCTCSVHESMYQWPYKQIHGLFSINLQSTFKSDNSRRFYATGFAFLFIPLKHSRTYLQTCFKTVLGSSLGNQVVFNEKIEVTNLMTPSLSPLTTGSYSLISWITKPNSLKIPDKTE
jgi:hypothetical protein